MARFDWYTEGAYLRALDAGWGLREAAYVLTLAAYFRDQRLAAR